MYSDHGTGVVHPQVNSQSAEPKEEKIFKYSEKHGKIVKWMAVVKVLAAIGLILLQSSATALQHIFEHHVKRIEDEHSYRVGSGYDIYNLHLLYAYDRNAVGAWLGLMSLLAAVISLSSSKKQDKNLIITALSLNCFSLLASGSWTVFGALSFTDLFWKFRHAVKLINQEREAFGTTIRIDDAVYTRKYDTDDTCALWLLSPIPTTPNTLPSAVFFGEKFDAPCVMFQWESTETVLQPTIYLVHNARNTNTEGSFSDRFRVVALTGSTHHATKSDKLVAGYLMGLMPAPEQAGELTPIAEP